jgi:SAM-dependent methyltransferase
LYGVEIHPEAALKAKIKGIDIIAEDFETLSKVECSMDVVIACDVIEHTPDPRSFIEALSSKVRNGGYLLITTGNTNAFSWRLMGSHYWYCFIAEHISFINPSWAERVARDLGLQLEKTVFFSHSNEFGSLLRRITEAVANLLLRFFPYVSVILRRLGFGGINIHKNPDLKFSPPSWMTARDHMFLVFRKSPSP